MYVPTIMSTDKIYDNLNLMKGETQLQIMLLRKKIKKCTFLRFQFKEFDPKTFCVIKKKNVIKKL